MSSIVRVEKTQAEQMLDDAYKSFFETPTGRVVFKDLYRKAFTTAIDKDAPNANAALMHAGQQVLMQYVMKRSGLSHVGMADEEIQDAQSRQASTQEGKASPLQADSPVCSCGRRRKDEEGKGKEAKG